MSSKGKNVIICLLIFLIIVFIYTPLRTDKLERQFVHSSTAYMDKIVISLVSFEKNKKLKDKNLSNFYKIIKKKYPNIALVTIADKNNKILKAGKDDRFIKSNKTFDAILDSFTRDEFRPGGRNDFLIRYYDHNRFYISARNVKGGKILSVFPYKLEIKVLIQLGLELLLILIISLILTAFIIIIKNRRAGNEAVRLIKKEKEISEKDSIVDIRETRHHKRKEKTKNILQNIDIDPLNDTVYDLFKDVIQENKPQNLSLYLYDKGTAKLYKVYELKGTVFAKTDNLIKNSIELTDEISEALTKSSIILKEKGSDLTIPLLYSTRLLGTLNLKREQQFIGPEINNIKESLKVLIEPLSNLMV